MRPELAVMMQAGATHVDGGPRLFKVCAMLTRYVEPQNTRCIRETVDGVEQLRIPMRRNWFVLLFLSFWICGWTMGGIAAVYSFAETHSMFLLLWLCGWAAGWVFAAGIIGSQIAGSEIIRVTGRDLETSIGVGKLRWRRIYRGDHIRNLASSDPNPMRLPWRVPEISPFRPRAGAVKFDYGSQTLFAAGSVDEAEGRMIVEWLRPKLPRSVTENL